MAPLNVQVLSGEICVLGRDSVALILPEILIKIKKMSE